MIAVDQIQKIKNKLGYSDTEISEFIAHYMDNDNMTYLQAVSQVWEDLQAEYDAIYLQQ